MHLNDSHYHLGWVVYELKKKLCGSIRSKTLKAVHHRGTEYTEVYFIVCYAAGVANNKKPFSVYSVPLW